MQIESPLSLQPQLYRMPEPFVISADSITIDGNGATLVGDDQRGSGIIVDGARDVTIRDLRLLNFYHAIVVRDCERVTLSNCTVSATHELPPNATFLNIFTPVEQAYGAGILLHNVKEVVVEGCDLSHQQNGLLIYGGRDLRVQQCRADYCSGFGFYFNDVRDSLISDCSADFNTRVHARPNGGEHFGADAAGFVIVNNSCNNRFIGNRARMGGDGFFLAGLHHDGTPAPCNDNLFERNDGSRSPNIAFEATFSRGNIFRNNRADDCNYGFWLGFSAENRLENNHIHGNRQAGIAVENGVGMTAVNNDIGRNGHGLLLWSKYVEKFARAVPDNDTSRDWTIADNSFSHNGIAIAINHSQDHGIRPIPAPSKLPKPHNHSRHNNRFNANGRDELIGDDVT